MTGAAEKHGFDPARLDRIASWMDRYVEERKFPGSSVMIVAGGDEIYFNAAGQRNIEAGLAFERDTVARIYSMTKPVTSVAIMMLAELGLFHLDAPVSEFIPAFSDIQALVDGAERIDQTEASPVPTLHQLLTHTSGLSYPFNPGVLPQEMERQKILFRADDSTLQQMADKAAALPLAFQPGKHWEYSISIDILGRVVEVVSEDRALLVFDDEVLRERLRGGDAGVLGSGFLRPVSHRGHLRFTLVILTPPGAVEGEY